MIEIEIIALCFLAGFAVAAFIAHAISVWSECKELEERLRMLEKYSLNDDKVDK